MLTDPNKQEGGQEKSQPPSFSYEPVFSSHVAEAAYDRGSRRLRVRFTDGSEYEYRNVAQSEYNDLMQAGSTGAFMAQFKKTNKGERV